MNIKQAIELAAQQLSTETPKRDAEYLLADLLNKNFTWLKTWPDYELNEAQQIGYLKMLSRRKQGEPIAYITGERAFWTLNLNTNPSTLIPRPETELLVETALEYLAGKKPAKVLDLGCGTGAIALSIASERPDDSLHACDFNADAVALAKSNAVRNQIDNIQIIQSDWFSKIREMDFDLILSNPPYIEVDDPHLNQGDVRFEPHSALVAEEDGLADIKTIACQAKEHLKPQGCLMVEHGFKQGEKVRGIFLEQGYQEVDTLLDLAGHERITVGFFGG